VSHQPGDDLISDANMVFDRMIELTASPEQIWPWLVQLGKRRAGWYMPARVERIVPPSRRGAWHLDPRWQTLNVGERIPDYGGPRAELEVASIDPERTLVYRSQRRGTAFSWALILHPVSPTRTRVQLRFRGRVTSTGWRYQAIMRIGDLFDRLTGELLLRGLRERVAAQR
jgi:hypothetical protein